MASRRNRASLDWERKYSSRKRISYIPEKSRLRSQTTSGLIDQFIGKRPHELAPPDHLSFSELRSFLLPASLNHLPAIEPGDDTEGVVLLDDRKNMSIRDRLVPTDTSTGQVSVSKAFSIHGFVTKTLNEEVTYHFALP